MKRSALSVVTVLVLCCAILAGATLAYLNDKAQASNTFVYDSTGDGTKKQVGIKVDEPGWDATKATDFSPGAAITKDPYIESTGKKPCYVGIMVTSVSTTHPATGVTGTHVDLSTLESLQDASKRILSLDYDNANWKEVTTNKTNPNARYFVYIGGSKNGELDAAGGANVRTATPLFSTVTVSPNANTLLDATDCWDIQINAFAVQAEKPSGVSTWDAETAIRLEFGAGGQNAEAGIWNP